LVGHACVDQLARIVANNPRVASSSVRRRTHRGELERWLVVRVRARSWDEASTVAFDAALAAMRPDDDVQRIGPYAIGIHQVTGLTAYETEPLPLMSRTNGTLRRCADTPRSMFAAHPRCRWPAPRAGKGTRVRSFGREAASSARAAVQTY